MRKVFDRVRMRDMQSELQIGQQMIRFDREATVALYRDTITTPDADRCTCVSCKNFAAQRSRVYPEDFLNLLEKLGITALTEWEAFDYDFDLQERPNHLYGGWFLFCGELIVGVRERPNQVETGFSYWFTSSFPTPQLPGEVKICAVEFSVQVPWIPQKAID